MRHLEQEIQRLLQADTPSRSGVLDVNSLAPTGHSSEEPFEEQPDRLEPLIENTSSQPSPLSSQSNYVVTSRGTF